MNISDERADDGRAQMTGMERLGNIWRGELDYNLLSLADVVISVGFSVGKDRIDSEFLQQLAIDLEIEKRSSGCYFDDMFAGRVLRRW